MAKGEGSRGGKIVGHTKSGKPIYGDQAVRIGSRAVGLAAGASAITAMHSAKQTIKYLNNQKAPDVLKTLGKAIAYGKISAVSGAAAKLGAIGLLTYGVGEYAKSSSKGKDAAKKIVGQTAFGAGTAAAVYVGGSQALKAIAKNRAPKFTASGVRIVKALVVK